MNVTQETGSALASVLSIIVILSVLVGVMLSAETIQYRFVGQNLQQLQARYTAEAGVYSAIAALKDNPLIEFVDSSFTLATGLTSQVSVGAHGGYYLVRSEVVDGRFQITMLATIGERPPEIFNKAVYMWDTDSRLNVAGSTVIKGDVEVGRLGIGQKTFRGVKYSGELKGVSSFNPDIKPPFFDDHLINQSIKKLDKILSDGATSEGGFSDFNTRVLLPEELPVFYSEGDLIISRADSMLLDQPAIIAASGDLILDGPFQFAKGTQFLAGNRIVLHGEIFGELGIFYGRNQLLTEGQTIVKGQFFSQGSIAIRDSTYLKYPSLLFLSGKANEAIAEISISGVSHVDGSVVHGLLSEPPTDVRGRIIVEQDATIRGGIFNPYETELRGVLYGSLVTHRLYFYESPTSYINWLMDAKVDITGRPEGFFLPVLFGGSLQDFEVVSWDVYNSYQTTN